MAMSIGWYVLIGLGIAIGKHDDKRDNFLTFLLGWAIWPAILASLITQALQRRAS